MSLGRQFLLLMWKNWVLQKRKICVSVFEIIMPVSFALLLVLIRTLVETEYINSPTTFPAVKPDSVRFGFSMVPKVFILYTPRNPQIDSVMNDMRNFLPPRPDFNGSIALPVAPPSDWIIRGFSSESELLEFYDLFYMQVWAGIEFDPSQSYASGLPKNVRYSLRVTREDPGTSWRTQFTYPFFQTPGYRSDDPAGGNPEYFELGFLALQTAIDKAITRHFNPGADFAEINLAIKKMPYPPFVKDGLLTILQVQLPVFLLLSFILVALQTSKAIVYEKERNLKEAMKLMGMNSFMYWFTWFLKNLIYLMIAIAMYTILFSINVGDMGKVLPKSDPSLIYIFLLTYVMSIVAFCFMVSTFFDKANAGAFAGGILYYVTYIPYYFLQSRYETMTKDQKLFACLLNNMAMAFGINTVGLYEGAGDGVQWSNFYKPASVDDNFSLLDAMLMLLGDTAIYLLITWYVDSVHPGTYGVPLPWYFPFTKTYWCGTPKKQIFDTTQQSDTEMRNFERDPTGLNVGISILHLRKVFGSGKKKKVAVDDTTLNMYEGQITALLGHNGAGKTTTMSMLTGFLPPTSGTASVNGFDIREDIRAVRQSLGLCPQHNILFDTMTVEEHLYFFAMLKGCPRDKVQQEIDEMITVLGLEAKRNKFSSTLSGGQKRKLCVGIAIIAGSKVVILDEPTSGMDPAARRQTWDILQKFKTDRTLVLSTHFMDEADLLGDRIAIMSEGVVKCCGSSLFLKKLYGAGYHLIMVKNSTCDVSKVTELVQSHIATAELKSAISAELSYLLPFDESPKFEKLFLDIENQSEALGLTSFGTSATTMEEVFLTVGREVPEEEDANGFDIKPLAPATSQVAGKSEHVVGIDNSDTRKSTEVLTINAGAEGSFIGFNSVLTKNTGIRLTVQQMWGMFVKKFIHTRRNTTITLVQLLLPVLFTILALTAEKTIPKAEDDPSLALDLQPFEDVKFVQSGGRNPTSNTTNLALLYQNSLTNEGHTAINFTDSSLSQFTDFDDFFLGTIENIGTSVFRNQYILAGSFEPDGATDVNVTAYFNDETYHAVAISLAYVMNTLVKYFNDDTHSISTTNFPFPKPVDDSSRVGISAQGTGFTIAFTILFGISFLSSSFIVFLIKERSTGAKHLQKVSGVSSLAFWVSNFTWDLINFFIPVVLILICFAAFQTQAYTEDSRLGLVFLIFLLFGWACLPYVYNLQFLFTNSATGMVVVTMINVITGLATLMAVFVISIPDLGIPEIVVDSLDWIFTIFLPNYCLGESLLNIYTNYAYRDICIAASYQEACGNANITTHPCCKDKCGSNCFIFQENYLSLETPGSGKYVLFMLIQGFVYFCLVFVVEFGLFERIFYKLRSGAASSGKHLGRQISNFQEQNEDSDVLEEKRRIDDTDLDQLLKSDSLVLKNLSKTYGSFRAVKNISVGIGQQECFGLLGQNGAGKTSTFKMLTGDVLVTDGNAYLNTFDIQQSLVKVQQNLGYCPQFDALIEQMTGRETLTMYARLRGVQEKQIKNTVNELLDTMMLRKHADKKCGAYSGGNKRKLSTAIALVGDPPFILLDEPTTGMDPGARRQLWNVLSQIRASGRTLILTSHSMEECDALCTKIAIMVNGRFVCLGSSQHLKSKYGQGYTLIVRLPLMDNGFPAPSEPLRQFVTSTFPESNIFDDHQGYLHFQIPDSSVPLARVFGVMENAKKDFNIEDYSVHQTTLEQVFLTFTRNQIPPVEKEKKGMCSFLPCCR